RRPGGGRLRHRAVRPLVARGPRFSGEAAACPGRGRHPHGHPGSGPPRRLRRRAGRVARLLLGVGQGLAGVGRRSGRRPGRAQRRGGVRGAGFPRPPRGGRDRAGPGGRSGGARGAGGELLGLGGPGPEGHRPPVGPAARRPAGGRLAPRRRSVPGAGRAPDAGSRTGQRRLPRRRTGVRPVKILMISWEYPPVIVGGLGRHVHHLAVHLAAQGHEVVVLSRRPSGTDAASHPTVDHLAEGVRVVAVAEDPPHFVFGEDMMAWTLAMGHAIGAGTLPGEGPAGESAPPWTPDVIHAHDWLVAHPAIALAEHFAVPLVATIHATEAGRHAGWVSSHVNRQVHSVEWWLANA